MRSVVVIGVLTLVLIALAFVASPYSKKNVKLTIKPRMTPTITTVTTTLEKTPTPENPICQKIMNKFKSIGGYRGNITVNGKTYRVVFIRPNEYELCDDRCYYYCAGVSWIYENGTLKRYDKNLNRYFYFLNYSSLMSKCTDDEIVVTNTSYIIKNIEFNKTTLLPVRYKDIKFNVSAIEINKGELHGLECYAYDRVHSGINWISYLKKILDLTIYIPQYPTELPLFFDDYVKIKSSIMLKYESMLLDLAILEFNVTNQNVNLTDYLYKKGELKTVKIDENTTGILNKLPNRYELVFVKDNKTLIKISTNIIDEEELLKIARSMKPIN